MSFASPKSLSLSAEGNDKLFAKYKAFQFFALGINLDISKMSLMDGGK